MYILNNYILYLTGLQQLHMAAIYIGEFFCNHGKKTTIALFHEIMTSTVRHIYYSIQRTLYIHTKKKK